MTCPLCNHENRDGVKFCVNCGTDMTAAQSNQQVSQPAPVNRAAASPVQAPPVSTGSDGKGLSVAALVCGLLGIIGSFIPFVKYFTLVLAILGIVFGAIGMKKVKASGSNSTGLATAGLVLGIIGTAFSAVGVICALACVGAASTAADSILDSGVIESAKEAVKETVTSAANDIADKIASSAADKANEIASSAADKVAQAASDSANSFVSSIFSAE